MNPGTVCARLRPVDGEFGDQLVRATADGDGQTSRLMDRLPNALSTGMEWLVVVEAFGAGEIHVPLVDARRLDHRRELLQQVPDLGALRQAGLEGYRHAHRVWTKTKGSSDRHR